MRNHLKIPLVVILACPVACGPIDPCDPTSPLYPGLTAEQIEQCESDGTGGDEPEGQCFANGPATPRDTIRCFDEPLGFGEAAALITMLELPGLSPDVPDEYFHGWTDEQCGESLLEYTCYDELFDGKLCHLCWPESSNQASPYHAATPTGPVGLVELVIGGAVLRLLRATYDDDLMLEPATTSPKETAICMGEVSCMGRRNGCDCSCEGDEPCADLLGEGVCLGGECEYAGELVSQFPQSPTITEPRMACCFHENNDLWSCVPWHSQTTCHDGSEQECDVGTEFYSGWEGCGQFLDLGEFQELCCA